jgi:hypothetical protein
MRLDRSHAIDGGAGVSLRIIHTRFAHQIKPLLTRFRLACQPILHPDLGLIFGIKPWGFVMMDPCQVSLNPYGSLRHPAHISARDRHSIGHEV